MLQVIRNIAHSWAIKGFLLLLILSFSIWGIGDMFRGNAMQKTVAEVGDVEISVQQLGFLFETALAEAKQQLGPELTANQARKMGLLDQALDREISRQLVDLDLKRQGLHISATAYLKILMSEPQLRDKDGSFNKALFRHFLEQKRMSEAEFIRRGQQDVSRQILVGAFEGPLPVSQTMVDAVFKGRAQQRILDVVSIDSTKVGGLSDPDDASLKAFYDGHKTLFTKPEYRGITIASFSAEKLAKKIDISEDELKKDYEAKRDQFAHGEYRNIVQVVVQSEAKAKELVAKARASKNLVSAAKALKQTPVPLEKIEERSLMPDLSAAIFSMEIGAVADPVKTQLGWHVVQLKKIAPAGTASFEDVRDQLLDELRQARSVQTVENTINRLDDSLAAGTSLDDIADSLRLRLVKVPAVDVSGRQDDGAVPSEFPNKDKVLAHAFGQGEGETSAVESDSAGNYYVVRTDSIIPAGVQSFDENKGTVAALWKRDQQAQKAREKAESVSKALAEGLALEAIKGDAFVSTRTSEPLSLLGDTDKQLPADLVARAFDLKKGDVASGDSKDGIIVVRLAKIVDVDAQKPDTRKRQIERELQGSSRSELLDEYLAHLRTVFPVKKNEALLTLLRNRGD